MGSIIKPYNNKLINSTKHHAQPCSCRKKEACSLEEKGITENIIYKCTVSTSGYPDKAYLGNAEDLKKR